jgi:RHS repeat-associated protein
MKVRDSQRDALAAATMDRVRRERILELRQQGFGVTEDPTDKALVVRDAAGCSARVESLGLRARVVSAEGRVTETEQHHSGRIRRIVDPSGREVHFERDSDGFLQSINRGSDGGTYHFQLSPEWQPLRIEYPDGTTSLGEYSPTGQPTRVVQRDGTELRYEYGATGELASLIDPKGRRTRLIDAAPGTSRRIEYPNGDLHEYIDDVKARLLRFEVNGENHAVYRRDPETGAIEVRYVDGSAERFLFKGTRLLEGANEHATVKFEYDNAGRLLSEDTNGRIVRYLRNEIGALVGIVTSNGDTLSYHRDRDQRLTAISDWRGDHYEIALPPAGLFTEIRYPNGLSVSMKANAMGLPAEFSLRRSDKEQIEVASWEHDTCDRLTADTRNGRQRRYRYSKSGRLVGVGCPDRRLAESFELDSCGNRVQHAGARCDYDAMNRLLRQGSREFAYDGLGNQVAERDRQRATTYTYNGRGQLVGVRTPNHAIEYQYDPLGRRIRKRVDGLTTTFEWAGTQLLSETIGEGKQSSRRDYFVCPEFLSPLAFREGSSVYYMHLGRLQEPLCVTDRGGEVVWSAEYLAFGEVLTSVDKVRQPLRLPGQYHDEETDLQYSVARYYAPDLGRFLSMDPHRQPGASLNYYLYCDGDPVNRVDPIGEISLTLGAVLIGIGIGMAVGAAVGVGVELYKERNQDHINVGQVATAGLIGACLGGIGAAVGIVATAAAATAMGVVAAGAVGGGAAGAVTYCVQAIGQGHWIWGEFGLSVIGGALIGAVTAGIGGLIANRAAPEAEQSPLLQRYLGGSGGRWGSTQTRLLNHNIASDLEDQGFTVTGGAGRASEEWIPGPGGGTKGGTFVDITATNGETTVRVQTVTTLADGVTPTPSEAAAAARIRAAYPNDELRIVPK